ncbi:MAG: hypothetical protein HOE43_08950 [Chloroflexi bacterium]|jgi:hypothetical protein|nr:hypothetical protein [Chloroflexota bacterium]
MSTQTLNVELDYDPQAKQASDAAGKPGGYIGSGVGTATGDINGSIAWDLYEDQSPEKCDASFVGVITTPTGDEINFQTRGMLLAPTPAEPAIFRTNSEIVIVANQQFPSDLKGDWIGTFDASTYHHSYVVNVQ